MRLIKTYLLRLFTDTDATERICGAIRPLDENQSYSFKNIADLIDQLHQWIAQSLPETPSTDSSEPKDSFRLERK